MEILFNFIKVSVLIALLTVFISHSDALQCYQCDSNEDSSCPSSEPFDRNINALIDCNSFEAEIPGTFCMKITQQSPGWFAWKKITRRCGSRSDTGVAWGCRWVFEENGVWKETCYCEDRDGCNTAAGNIPNIVTVVTGLLLVAALHFYMH